MLRAIIVDDELLVRQGLRSHYHWDKYDICVEEDFPDGQAAYEYVSVHPIDLLITDVVMPRMDGLTLARKLREKNEELKIIFISGYADAKYLSDALRMNAVDYIFKSIDFDALDSAIERVINQVEQRNSELAHRHWLEQQLLQSQDLLCQQRLVSLISYHEESERALADSCKVLSIPLNSQSSYVVLVVQITNRWSLLSQDNSARSEIMLDLDIQNSLSECLRRRGNTILFKKRSYEYITILGIDGEEYEELLLTVSSEIRTLLSHQFHAEVAIGLSEGFRGLQNVRPAYKNACEAIYNRYLLDASMPEITIMHIPQKNSLAVLREHIRAEVNSAILGREPTAIQNAAIAAIASADTLPTPDEQQNMLLWLLMLPQDLLRDVRPSERGCYASHRKLIEQYLLLSDPHDQEDYIVRAFLAVSELLSESNSQQNNFIINRVRDYIDVHYTEAISIDALADQVYLTPTYLCVLFKKYTGRTINSYLTEVRLEKAKDLLKNSSMHLQDICYRIGYLSPSYFSRLFRKYYGLTPSEYRESLADQE